MVEGPRNSAYESSSEELRPQSPRSKPYMEGLGLNGDNQLHHMV